MKHFVDQDFSRAEFRECVLNGTRLIGVVMQGAEIDGLVTNLVVNGVDVTSYVEAELDRRHPVRMLIRSDARLTCSEDGGNCRTPGRRRSTGYGPRRASSTAP
ncbi:MAG TPA: hypothetical protein VGF84_19055 [Micromonosporaceae bacterium]